MSCQSLDTNINNYETKDLIEIFQITEITKDQIRTKADSLIALCNDPDMRRLLNEGKQKLLEYVENNIDIPGGLTTSEGYLFLNSLYRSTNSANSTNYVANLSEPLKNIQDLQIINISVPFTWYNIDDNTNFFYVNGHEIKIKNGYYNSISIINELNSDISFSNFLIADFDENTNLVTFSSHSSSSVEVIFFSSSIGVETYFNYSLGWFLGFRNESYTAETFTGEAVINLNNFHYLIVSIDDFNNNKNNTPLLTNTSIEQTSDIPSYFHNDLPVTSNPNDPIQVSQGVPRQITEAQQYTINETFSNRNANHFNYVNNRPISDVLAIIPIAHPISYGETYVQNDFSPIKRTYIGKVNIERMQIKLFNEHGRIVNLNGSDWSFAIKYSKLMS